MAWISPKTKHYEEDKTMAVAKKLNYADMTPAQKKLAEKIARRYGMPVEEVSMTKKTGMIIVNREDCPHLSSVDWALIREGLHYDEITDEHREEYLEALKRDRISDEDKAHAKETFAALRGK